MSSEAVETAPVKIMRITFSANIFLKSFKVIYSACLDYTMLIIHTRDIKLKKVLCAIQYDLLTFTQPFFNVT